jgi:class 3 adenylate cyclase/pimeloyl-ACP methyl ester carboxylesterase
MEPRIQYVTTPDGVSIAYWAIGDGIPLVYITGPPFNHVQLEWRMLSYRQYYEHFSETFKVVRFDSRGSGLSDRAVTDLSLDALITDLETVAGRLGLDKFMLLGVQSGGLIALEYALRRPNRVSQLVLWDAYPGAKDFLAIPRVQAFMGLIETDWELFTETLGSANFGWGSGQMARDFAAFVRESATPEGTEALFDALGDVDFTSRLPDITQPTLVIQHSNLIFPGMDTARLLASRIPDAELLVINGTWGDPEDSMDAVSRSLAHLLRMEPPPPAKPRRESRLGRAVGSVLDAVNRFEEADEKRRASRSASPGGLATILFTDVEGSTALTQRLGDAGARSVLREHERITREAIREHHGSEIKTTGDGFMASFSSATRALECAIAIQQSFAEGNTVGARHPPSADDITATRQGPVDERQRVPRGASPLRASEDGIRVRIGMNAGEPIAEEDDLFGTAVIVAARIAALAHGGEILVSDVVRQLVAGKGFLFNDRGEHPLKGFEDPVRVFEVRWRDAG